MYESETETGPLPLTVEEVEQNKFFLRGTHVSNYGGFNEFGLFRVSSNRHSRGGLEITGDESIDSGGGAALWSHRLLGLSPDEYMLRLRQSPGIALQLINKEHRQVAGSISVRDVRSILLGGIEVVGESGYLINPRVNQDIDRKDRILAEADQGRRPSHFNNSHYVKLLESGMAGQNVLYLYVHLFRGSPVEVIQDGVVIDLQTKRLLRRRFEQPLAYATWGEPFVPGHHTNIELPIPNRPLLKTFLPEINNLAK